MHLGPFLFFLVPDFDFEFCGGNQNFSVTNMCKIILTNVPVEGGIVYSYVNGFFDGSSKVVPLPTYYAEVLH